MNIMNFFQLDNITSSNKNFFDLTNEQKTEFTFVKETLDKGGKNGFVAIATEK